MSIYGYRIKGATATVGITMLDTDNARMHYMQVTKTTASGLSISQNGYTDLATGVWTDDTTMKIVGIYIG